MKEKVLSIVNEIREAKDLAAVFELTNRTICAMTSVSPHSTWLN